MFINARDPPCQVTRVSYSCNPCGESLLQLRADAEWAEQAGTAAICVTTRDVQSDVKRARGFGARAGVWAAWLGRSIINRLVAANAFHTGLSHFICIPCASLLCIPSVHPFCDQLVNSPSACLLCSAQVHAFCAQRKCMPSVLSCVPSVHPCCAQLDNPPSPTAPRPRPPPHTLQCLGVFGRMRST